MVHLFKKADKDNNNFIDKQELRNVLESCSGGLQYLSMHWISEEDVDQVMRTYDLDKNGGLDFEEFVALVMDGILLDGSYEQYRTIFEEVDVDKDGSLMEDDLRLLFQKLDRPVSHERISEIMKQFDKDGSKGIDFSEFLHMFQEHLFDLNTMLRFVKMKPAHVTRWSPREVNRSLSVSPGTLTFLQHQSQMEAILSNHRSQPVVVMFGLSFCNVCRTTTRQLETLVPSYPQARFCKMNVDDNPDAKNLFKNELLGRYVPSFFYFLSGNLVHTHSDGDMHEMERVLRELLELQQPAIELAPPVFPQLQRRAVT